MPDNRESSETRQDVVGLLLILVALLCALSMSSFAIAPTGANWLGLFGRYCGYSLHFLFGAGGYLLVGYIGWTGWRLLTHTPFSHPLRHRLAFTTLLIACCVLLNLMAEQVQWLAEGLESSLYGGVAPRTTWYNTFYLGGTPWQYLYADIPYGNLKTLLNIPGTVLVCGGIVAASVLALSDVGLQQAVERVVPQGTEKEEQVTVHGDNFGSGLIQRLREHLETWAEKLSRRREPPPLPPSEPSETEEPTPFTTLDDRVSRTPSSSPARTQPVPSKREAAIEQQRVWNGDFRRYQLPKSKLLTDAVKSDQSALKKDLRKQAERLEETLASFGIEARVGQIHCGPRITSFEVHPAVGVKVQKIKTLENDIALNLEAESIRIIAPIPGKGAIGIEIPNPQPQEVGFKELLQAYRRSNGRLRIPLLLGKTVNGDDVMADLAKMPHCIIAGATGSGKSVCINTIVMSILMTAKPDQIRLLMVDPKKVELSSYSRLPHMLAPVITEPGEATAALNWLVKEMEQRYDLLKHLGLRNIEAFNGRSRDEEAEEALPVDVPEKLPYIVGIIDELADLMMVASSDIETPIARIAQMARAVGIHLILATQRPSREVITGLIKANFPTRISFKVASRINSQIVLDDTGAETLLGNGDMLFLPPGTSTLIRAQGAFIRDEDIRGSVKCACEQAPPMYVTESFQELALGLTTEGQVPSDLDDLYQEAYRIVTSTGNASTTFLQRKLKIGYARAASIIDQLEEQRVIGPPEGAKGRKVLVALHGDDEAPGLEE